MTKSLFVLSLLITVCLLTSNASAQPELDTTFASGGKRTIVYGATASADDIVVQPDNKIVLVSSCGHIVLGFNPFCLVRINENGTFDPTFQTSSMFSGVYTQFGSDVTGVTIQNDSKIVAVGYGAFGNDEVAMVRYNTDGSLDLTFGTEGKVRTDITAGVHDRGKKVAVQPDGNILVVGRSGTAQFVARYLTNGTLDPSFGTGGVAKAIIAETTTTGQSIALQPDGKILAGGGTSSAYLLSRFNADGTPDTTWDGDGIATIGAGGSGDDEGLLSLALQTDGRVVAVGHNNIIYRFNANGSIDTSFDNDGSRQALENFSGIPRDVVISPGGRITVVGERRRHTGPGSVPYLYLTARYLTNGSPDPGYSDDGFLDIDVLSSGADGAWAAAADSLGRIVIAGRSAAGTVQNPFEQSSFSIARLLAPPGAAVGISGRVTDAAGNPVSRAVITAQGGGGARIAITSPFGYYQFENLQVGQIYTLSVGSKRFSFTDRSVFVGEQVTDFDFVGDPVFSTEK